MKSLKKPKNETKSKRKGNRRCSKAKTSAMRLHFIAASVIWFLDDGHFFYAHIAQPFVISIPMGFGLVLLLLLLYRWIYHIK